MKKLVIKEQAIEIDKRNICLIPTIWIYDNYNGISIEFHFLIFHAGVLFEKRGGRQ